jgi:hypothetical protein
LFYFPQKQYLYCHNCSKSWKPFEWVKEVTTLTVPEIIKRNAEKTNEQTIRIVDAAPKKQIEIPELPINSIELTDSVQFNFFKTNKIVKLAYDYCIERRLFSAVNSCKKFYVSLDDRIHKNRLIIPFFDINNKIVCYQTRSLYKDQHPKYLTKYGEKEDVFGSSNIDSTIPYVFIFEGPIDSMFIKNGVAMASLSPTEKQLNKLYSLIGYEFIYVFDNDKDNKQTRRKVESYINKGYNVFVWPKEFKQFKDFNEICCKLQLNEIPWNFVVKNSANGSEALIKQKIRLLA